MKEPMNPQEYRLLAVIIFSGFCANSRYHHVPDYHIRDAIRLLNQLLAAIDKTEEVK